MKFRHGKLICEQCGATSPDKGSFQETSKHACLVLGWDYVWEHLSANDHVAHCYCSRCKVDFNCELKQGK